MKFPKFSHQLFSCEKWMANKDIIFFGFVKKGKCRHEKVFSVPKKD